jgi:FtsP/CotA-like multicopper oxidase with cupredoxin domain
VPNEPRRSTYNGAGDPSHRSVRSAPVPIAVHARFQPGKADAMTDQDFFPTDTTGLADVAGPQVVRLADGDRFGLSISSVRKDLGGDLRMLAYNGSIPGPNLHVPQGGEITVDVRNDGDVETTVHWHGLRLENRYDGVPHETQAPIPVGGGYSCRVQFPDAGFYWYHPHMREDYAQEMGLYGTIVVEPSDPGYWPAVDREQALTLDDLLVEDGHITAFSRSGPNFTAMGRFGNVLLINGETAFAGDATVGEVVRLYLVNTANTRLFNFALGGARMKLVGGDSGRYERETFIEDVLLAPSERAVVDVLFDAPGEVRLEHRTPDRTYDLGAFTVVPAIPGQGAGAAAGSFATLRTDPELTAERRMIEHDLDREPDKILAFVSQMPLLYGDDVPVASSYACPMHPDVTATEPATCPICGMRLVAVAVTFVCPMHPDVIAAQPATCPICGMKLVAAEGAPTAAHEAAPSHDHGDGLEWEDLMPEINRASEPGNMIWQLIDRETGAENGAIVWAFTVGDRVKIRLVNEMDQDHPMHHPFHIHGAGRFLVLARDGAPEPNLVWKDTVLLPAGATVDILLDVSNPGLWMAHCHIAEHTESGMMFSFNVARRPEPVR